MVYAGIQTFMAKLKQLINCNDIPSINHPQIIHERPQLQLLYDELHNPIIQTLFIDQHQHLEKVNHLKKRFIDVAEEAEYIVDLFVSAVNIGDNELFTTPQDFNRSLNLDDVMTSFEFVKLGIMFLSAGDNQLFTTSEDFYGEIVDETKYIGDLFLSAGDNQLFTTSEDFYDEIVDETKYIGDLFLSAGDNPLFTTPGDFKRSLNIDESVKVELASRRIDNMKIASSPTTETNPSQFAAAPVSFTRNSKGSKKLMDEIVVGLDADLQLIRDKLVDDQKKLHVVSIVGMGGIGKTTLATKVFNDHFVMYHFHVRVWVTVSQTYDKRDVLIQILESICGQPHLQKDNSDSRLRELVHKKLMGKRYLIVIDDIWHTETWDNLKVFFPHDNNGSRILLTSRLMKVAKHANSDGLIHQLGYLSKQKSWDLLCQKVFCGNECPEWSIKPGMQIVENCHGLPLAVLVIAGVLAKGACSTKFWEEIAHKTSLYTVGDHNGCMETLALSYNHLPFHLRECFLYIGGFQEDHTFYVQRLIWKWVAEGFIQEDGNLSLEDIAEGYLMDLIDRNLVIIAQRKKSNGAVKACKLHDLIRELCLKKAKEEQFILQTLSSQSSSAITPPYKPVRMFLNEAFHHRHFAHLQSRKLRSLLGYGCETFLSDDIAKHFHSFVLLRVLDLERCKVNDFSKGMEMLVHLRYLKISILSTDFPSSICNLWNLQALIYTSSAHFGIIYLPSNILDLVNLRHLHCNFPVIVPSIEKPVNLQTISVVELRDGLDMFQKGFPYIKKLKCEIYGDEEYDFNSLTCLEELKVDGWKEYVSGTRIRRMKLALFPETLKTLALKWCRLRWSDMSIIQSLPNLQMAFEGNCWNTDKQEFPQLKLLRLSRLDIKQWEAYSISFPCLKQLEISYCKYLEEIPLEIGDIPMLELIKIKWCRPSLRDSVRRIQEEQNDLGNYDLRLTSLNVLITGWNYRGQGVR